MADDKAAKTPKAGRAGAGDQRRTAEGKSGKGRATRTTGAGAPKAPKIAKAAKTPKVAKPVKAPAAVAPVAVAGFLSVTDGATRAPRVRPAGQRLYDLPYSAPSPRMVNPELGLHNLVARAGHNAAYTIDVTLLDAPDHRLIRSGVLLAHRVLDGRGEWFMTAPDWQPLLPRDRIELMGHADLPEAFADLLRPLRRRATLGPVAALSCDRREFALRDDHGTTVALLRDDKVTVRRGGLTTARYREVMLTPVGPGLTEEQTGWLDRALLQAGATQVARFPRLVTRLGAPATGPTDIPQPQPFDPSASFRRFLSQLFSARLRAIVEADLAIRGGDVARVGQLADEAAMLRTELKGLAFVLDPEWLEDLYDELDWIILQAGPAEGGDEAAREHLLSRLRSERYLTLLERLVVAVRTPRLSESETLPLSRAQPRTQPAEVVMNELIRAVTARLRALADPLTPDSGTAQWDQAWQALAQVQAVAGIGRHVCPEGAARLLRRIGPISGLLAAIHANQTDAEDALTLASGLTPEEAFAAGRMFEREADEARQVRVQFVEAWAKVGRKLPS